MIIKYYIQIIKPRIVLGNLIALIGGFFLSRNIHANYYKLFYSLLGTSLIIASSCIFNNYIDRNIDSKMHRTQNRAFVRKLIEPLYALIYALFLLILGILILFYKVNILSCILAIIGCLIYTILYSLLTKRSSSYSTLIGSLSGSLPIVIGYCTSTNMLNLCTLNAFLIFVFWQISHFYSINIFYVKDYINAKIPTLPTIKGIKITRSYILLYTILYIFFLNLLPLNGYINCICMIFPNIFNLIWLNNIFSSYKQTKDLLWAKKSFFMSIISINSVSIAILMDYFLFFKDNH